MAPSSVICLLACVHVCLVLSLPISDGLGMAPHAPTPDVEDGMNSGFEGTTAGDEMNNPAYGGGEGDGVSVLRRSVSGVAMREVDGETELMQVGKSRSRGVRVASNLNAAKIAKAKAKAQSMPGSKVNPASTDIGHMQVPKNVGIMESSSIDMQVSDSAQKPEMMSAKKSTGAKVTDGMHKAEMNAQPGAKAVSLEAKPHTDACLGKGKSGHPLCFFNREGDKMDCDVVDCRVVLNSEKAKAAGWTYEGQEYACRTWGAGVEDAYGDLCRCPKNPLFVASPKFQMDMDMKLEKDSKIKFQHCGCIDGYTMVDGECILVQEHVVLKDLVNSPEHNGKVVTVTGHNDNGSVDVELEDDIVRVAKANFDAVVDEAVEEKQEEVVEKVVLKNLVNSPEHNGKVVTVTDHNDDGSVDVELEDDFVRVTSEHYDAVIDGGKENGTETLTKVLLKDLGSSPEHNGKVVTVTYRNDDGSVDVELDNDVVRVQAKNFDFVTGSDEESEDEDSHDEDDVSISSSPGEGLQYLKNAVDESGFVVTLQSQKHNSNGARKAAAEAKAAAETRAAAEAQGRVKELEDEPSESKAQAMATRGKVKKAKRDHAKKKKLKNKQGTNNVEVDQSQYKRDGEEEAVQGLKQLVKTLCFQPLTRSVVKALGDQVARTDLRAKPQKCKKMPSALSPTMIRMGQPDLDNDMQGMDPTKVPHIFGDVTLHTMLAMNSLTDTSLRNAGHSIPEGEDTSMLVQTAVGLEIEKHATRGSKKRASESGEKRAQAIRADSLHPDNVQQADGDDDPDTVYPPEQPDDSEANDQDKKVQKDKGNEKHLKGKAGEDKPSKKMDTVQQADGDDDPDTVYPPEQPDDSEANDQDKKVQKDKGNEKHLKGKAGEDKPSKKMDTVQQADGDDDPDTVYPPEQPDDDPDTVYPPEQPDDDEADSQNKKAKKDTGKNKNEKDEKGAVDAEQIVQQIETEEAKTEAKAARRVNPDRLNADALAVLERLYRLMLPEEFMCAAGVPKVTSMLSLGAKLMMMKDSQKVELCHVATDAPAIQTVDDVFLLTARRLSRLLTTIDHPDWTQAVEKEGVANDSPEAMMIPLTPSVADINERAVETVINNGEPEVYKKGVAPGASTVKIEQMEDARTDDEWYLGMPGAEGEWVIANEPSNVTVTYAPHHDAPLA